MTVSIADRLYDHRQIQSIYLVAVTHSAIGERAAAYINPSSPPPAFLSSLSLVFVVAVELVLILFYFLPSFFATGRRSTFSAHSFFTSVHSSSSFSLQHAAHHCYHYSFRISRQPNCRCTNAYGITAANRRKHPYL